MNKFLNKKIKVWCDGACKGNPGKVIGMIKKNQIY